MFRIHGSRNALESVTLLLIGSLMLGCQTMPSSSHRATADRLLDGQGYGLGDPVEKTCWVVTGIDESGMDVRSRSGAVGARIPFDVRPVYIVELK
jgi:hypothetical protein